ncbi:thioesterase II family protein [Streptomyces albireticuli]|uniref:thioesterase II family protein n=1 Tax=Streptomyces albireticuli TaxID=1940 RepID=UPI001E63AED4|nr:alpha/beta fold hydrolase [Streptomyces albireticuli]MCD9145438.1 alpha/beta fold hydrolase [Streptomyces albireticuli]MCD9164997.1 alpha/beta fold hydrolase [Streptomyces albireticuli]MCD9195412.1 alpha/beta fold hydrolase [Streptomyces albireticuli]
MHPPRAANPHGQPSLTALNHRPDAPVRLVCLPPAGLGPSFYLPWAPLLNDVDLYAVQLPGRETYSAQPSLTDPRQVTTALAEQIAGSGDSRPFALFGHSIGALLAYETARRMRRTHQRQPVLLALSALPAPHVKTLSDELAPRLLDGQSALADLLGTIGDLPPHIAQDLGLLTRVCTPLIADMLLSLHYKHQDEPPLDVPFAIYGGQSDPVATAEDLHAWNDLTTQPVTPQLFPGSHMYTADQTHALTHRLSRDLRVATRYASAP